VGFRGTAIRNHSAAVLAGDALIRTRGLDGTTNDIYLLTNDISVLKCEVPLGWLGRYDKLFSDLGNRLQQSRKGNHP
jgi:hypothetical protein